ncbi:hypothetical protein [Paenirhodobacter enshiensis]|uniref:hypothetical protein n=1 Tax=Paenirhodobacter enshiensis TaxID=1105367 RepID=UPI0035AEC4F1
MGQFSVEKPGHVSTEINSLALRAFVCAVVDVFEAGLCSACESENEVDWKRSGCSGLQDIGLPLLGSPMHPAHDRLSDIITKWVRLRRPDPMHIMLHQIETSMQGENRISQAHSPTTVQMWGWMWG